MARMLIAIVSQVGASSPQARAIEDLFQGSFVICGVILAIVVALIGYCIVRFRKRDDKEPKQTEGHTRLEIAWTVAPFLVLVALFVLTTRAMTISDPPPERDADLVVVAHQWWWEVRYRSGVVTANEIHIPTGRPLIVKVESADVVHDFWVPDLARKIDATPGHEASIWMQADKPGTYLGTCAEYCGAQHAWMRIVVVAQSPDDFLAWERHEMEPSPPPQTEAAARGRRIFNEKTCVDCHAISTSRRPGGERAAPDLTHVSERTTLGAGVMTNTPSDLARWLKEPQTIKTGSHMPDLRLTDQDNADLVAYLEGLK